MFANIFYYIHSLQINMYSKAIKFDRVCKYILHSKAIKFDKVCEYICTQRL